MNLIDTFYAQLAVLLHFEYRKKHGGPIWAEENEEKKKLWISIAETAHKEIKQYAHLYAEA